MHAALAVVLAFFIVLVLLAASAFAWFLYAAADRVSPLYAIKSGYSLVLHTDNVWKSANPLLDLKAADSILADPAFSAYREAYMSLRQNPLRKNKYASLIAGRRADVALYMQDGSSAVDMVAVTDTGVFASVVRLAARLAPLARVKDLEYVKDGGYFIYTAVNQKTHEKTRIYAKVYKNLVAVSLSEDSLKAAFEKDHSSEYSEEDKKLLASPSDFPFKLVMSASRLVSRAVPAGNEYLDSFAALLSQNAQSLLEFKIDDNDVQLQASLPLEPNAVDASPLKNIVRAKSSVPSLLTHLTDDVQFYTLLNAGDLATLKNAVFPILQKSSALSSQDLDSTWAEGEIYARKLFGKSIEELLFSWTGTEFAVLGMEGSSDPVFAIQIADEKKRQKAFDAINSSILIRTNSSLIVDGVRLPCLELPSFFKGILKMLKIELPRPYYFVKEGCIYFSESPQNLSILANRYKAGGVLAKNDTWRRISEGQHSDMALGLFYNLKRSVPFFLQGNTLVTKILKLYNIGRCDFAFDDLSLKAAYHAAAVDSYNNRLVPGFPVELQEIPDFALEAECGELNSLKENSFAPPAVFWVEGGKTVKSLELSSLAVSRLPLKERCYAVAGDVPLSGNGVLWVVDANGTVYLLDRKLSVVRGFPVMTGSKPSAKPAAFGGKLLMPTESGVVLLDDGGKLSDVAGPDAANFISQPAVCGDYAALYSKGFEGKIYLLKDGAFTNADNPMYVDGIAFGTPRLEQKDGVLYTAFVTQAGDFYLFADGTLLPGFPVSLPGVFYTNVQCVQGAYYALAESAELFRIDADGNFSKVAVPGLESAKEACMTSDGTNVYVSGNANYIYAFRDNLEIVYGFPVTGRGIPVITDVNGDGNRDCVALSLDKKLYAWTLK